MNIKEFLDKYGVAIGERIEETLTPLYKPGSITDFDGKIETLLRQPFPVQREIIKGVSEALYKSHRKRLFVSGEMGTGKTMIGLSLIHTAPRPLRVLVVAPGHLVPKWIREAEQTISGVRTYDLAEKNGIVITHLQMLKGASRPISTEIYVISKERLKLSYQWEPAFMTIRGRVCCPNCGERAKSENKYLSKEDLGKKKYKCHSCKTPLWQAGTKPRRYSPAEYIKKYLKGVFDMVVLDEIHDYKAGDTLQGNAMGQIIGCAEFFLGLTGTLNGGYADNLFYLLYRMDPAELSQFGYEGSMDFQKTYGVLEEIRKIDEKDLRYGRVNKKNVVVKKKPGVSPEVVGRHLLHRSVFIRLSDVIDGLPPYNESVITIGMDKVQEVEYKALESKFVDAVKQYKMRASGAMLQSLMSYPDSCVVFPENVDITKKDELGNKHLLTTVTAPLLKVPILPKEEELINIIRKEKANGRKVLTYVSFTGNRDIRDRLKNILEDEGFSVTILPETVEPKKREAWITAKAANTDVLITNPELVKVGLDLIDFPTIVFFEVGFNIFTLRQAARRAWRIGQKRTVNVYFMCYKDTMQETALSLIAKKIEVALVVEGDLPEGLATQMEEGGSLIEEMSKALVDGRHYSGAETAWANMRKKETEASLGVSDKEVIFTANAEQKVSKAKTVISSIIDNTLINVSVLNKKGKRQSTISIKYGDLDKVVEQNGPVQIALF